MTIRSTSTASLAVFIAHSHTRRARSHGARSQSKKETESIFIIFNFNYSLVHGNSFFPFKKEFHTKHDDAYMAAVYMNVASNEPVASTLAPVTVLAMMAPMTPTVFVNPRIAPALDGATSYR